MSGLGQDMQVVKMEYKSEMEYVDAYQPSLLGIKVAGAPSVQDTQARNRAKVVAYQKRTVYLLKRFVADQLTTNLHEPH